jgi:hypothetical protein
MALTSSVTTKLTTSYNATEIVQILTGTTGATGVGDLLFFQDLPFGSAHFVLTSGTAPSGGIQYTVANDGILSAGTPQPLTNPVSLGAVLTTLPNMIDLMTGTIAAAGPSTIGTAPALPAQTPYKYGQFNVISAAAAFVITVTIVLMGTRG